MDAINKVVKETEEEFSGHIKDVAYSGVMCLAIAMGMKTGLFELMVAMETPKTSQEIADAGNLKERHVVYIVSL